MAAADIVVYVRPSVSESDYVEDGSGKNNDRNYPNGYAGNGALCESWRFFIVKSMLVVK